MQVLFDLATVLVLASVQRLLRSSHDHKLQNCRGNRSSHDLNLQNSRQFFEEGVGIRGPSRRPLAEASRTPQLEYESLADSCPALPCSAASLDSRAALSRPPCAHVTSASRPLALASACRHRPAYHLLGRDAEGAGEGDSLPGAPFLRQALRSVWGFELKKAKSCCAHLL